MLRELLIISAFSIGLVTVTEAQTSTPTPAPDSGLISVDTTARTGIQQTDNPNRTSPPRDYRTDSDKDLATRLADRQALNTRTSGTRTSVSREMRSDDKGVPTRYADPGQSNATRAPRPVERKLPPVVGTPIPKTTPGTDGGGGTSGAGTGIGSVGSTTNINTVKSDGSANTSP